MMKKPALFCGRGRSGRLSAEEMAELPDRLLDAALALFNAQGYSDTTMEQVARAAGASTKTLYSRYANKAELVKSVVSRIVERSLFAHASATISNPGEADPRTYLLGLGRNMIHTMNGEAAGMVRIGFAEARRFPELAAMYESSIERARAIYYEALRIWQAQGLLPDLGDPRLAGDFCMSVLGDQPRIRIAMGQPMSEAEAEAHLTYAVDFFLRGCGYRPTILPA
jgi:AcrR family transcriptional regulator